MSVIALSLQLTVLRRGLCLQELDKQRGRGQQGAKSPLLWDEGQVDEFLQGSPVVKDVATRLKVLTADRGSRALLTRQEAPHSILERSGARRLGSSSESGTLVLCRARKWCEDRESARAGY